MRVPFAMVTVVALLAGAAALILSGPAPSAQGPRSRGIQFGVRIEDLASGKFLVARQDLPDPNFSQTVVLLARYDKTGAMGLIVNRRTRVPLSRLLAGLEAAKDRSDLAYVGGPVQRTGALALLRSRSKPEEAQHIFEDVYLVSSKRQLENAVTSGADSATLRVYLGYSGWGPSQLDREVELGSWFIFPGVADLVFSSDPDSVWSRLIKQTELRFALAPAGAGRYL